MIRFAGDDGVMWSRGHAKATTAVRGPVASLLLFTYGRGPASDPRLTVFGDAPCPSRGRRRWRCEAVRP